MGKTHLGGGNGAFRLFGFIVTHFLGGKKSFTLNYPFTEPHRSCVPPPPYFQSCIIFPIFFLSIFFARTYFGLHW